MSTATRQIERLERLANSASGNPRYRVHFTDGSSAVTKNDAAFCYEVTNAAYRDVPVAVTFTAGGQIADLSVGGA